MIIIYVIAALFLLGIGFIAGCIFMEYQLKDRHHNGL